MNDALSDALLNVGDPLLTIFGDRRFLCWRWEPRQGERQPTKVPYVPGVGCKAASNDPGTWRTYEEACATLSKGNFDGIGYCLMKREGLGALDLDHCRDQVSGALEPWALDLVTRADSYTEITPSGEGVRILGVASGVPDAHYQLPRGANGQKVEVFHRATKYITISEKPLDGTPRRFNDISAILLELQTERDGKKTKKAAAGRPQASEKRDARDDTKKNPPEDEGAPSLDGLPADIVTLIRHGAEPGADRSRELFKACAVMRRAGFAEGKIVATLHAHPKGIAARCFERGKDDLARHVRMCLVKIDAEEAAKRASTASTKGKLANYATVRAELRSDPRFAGFVAFNAFAQAIQLRRPIPGASDENGFAPRPWRDEDATDLAVVLNDAGFQKLSIGIVHNITVTEARVATFHPVREFLNGLVWDGKQRLSRLFFDHCGVEAKTPEQIAYVEAVTRCFFISAVARVMRPGCKADCMLVLEGAQGILKSKLLRALAVNDEWFSDSLPHDLASKDAKQHLAGKWIIEMSELTQIRGASIETLKGYLSCQEDKYRPPYGRNEVNVPRQCVFAGSTNARIYLHDPTGERRFWPLRLTDIKLDAIEPIVPQLWAEAVAAYRAREQWWLTPKLEAIAAEVQGDRRARDPWHADIASFVESQCPGIWFSTGEIFDRLKLEPQHRNKGHEMRVAEVLTELGCEHVRKMGAGKRQWGWQRLPPRPTPAGG